MKNIVKLVFFMFLSVISSHYAVANEIIWNEEILFEHTSINEDITLLLTDVLNKNGMQAEFHQDVIGNIDYEFIHFPLIGVFNIVVEEFELDYRYDQDKNKVYFFYPESQQEQEHEPQQLLIQQALQKIVPETKQPAEQIAKKNTKQKQPEPVVVSKPVSKLVHKLQPKSQPQPQPKKQPVVLAVKRSGKLPVKKAEKKVVVKPAKPKTKVVIPTASKVVSSKVSKTIVSKTKPKTNTAPKTVDLTWIYKLTGIGKESGVSYATIHRKDVKVGDIFDKYTVTDIGSNYLFLKKTGTIVDSIRYRIGFRKRNK